MNVNRLKEFIDRNKYLKMGALYLASGMVVMQFAESVVPALHFPQWSLTLIVVLVLAGLPITLLMTWITSQKQMKKNVSINKSKQYQFLKVTLTVLVLILLITGTILIYNKFIYKPRLFNSQLSFLELLKIDSLNGLEQDNHLLANGFKLKGNNNSSKIFDKENEAIDNSMSPLETVAVEIDSSNLRYTTTDHEHFQEISKDIMTIMKFGGETTDINGQVFKWYQDDKRTIFTTVQLKDNHSIYHLIIRNTQKYNEHPRSNPCNNLHNATFTGYGSEGIEYVTFIRKNDTIYEFTGKYFIHSFYGSVKKINDELIITSDNISGKFVLTDNCKKLLSQVMTKDLIKRPITFEYKRNE